MKLTTAFVAAAALAASSVQALPVPDGQALINNGAGHPLVARSDLEFNGNKLLQAAKRGTDTDLITRSPLRVDELQGTVLAPDADESKAEIVARSSMGSIMQGLREGSEGAQKTAVNGDPSLGAKLWKEADDLWYDPAKHPLKSHEDAQVALGKLNKELSLRKAFMTNGYFAYPFEHPANSWRIRVLENYRKELKTMIKKLQPKGNADTHMPSFTDPTA